MESENKKKASVNSDEMLEQMKDGVSSNIKAAADEIKDEINEASERVDAIKSQDDYQKPDMNSETGDEPSEAYAGVEKAPVKEKKSVNLSVGALVGIIVGCVAAVVAIFLIFWAINNYVNSPVARPQGSTIADVGDDVVTDQDLSYYIYATAMNKYYEVEGDMADGDLTDYDWDQTMDSGETMADEIKTEALNEAIDAELLIQYGYEHAAEDELWTESDDESVKSTVDGYVSQFGEDGFKLRARTMGISSPKQYQRMYATAIKSQTAQSIVEENLDQYMPEGVDMSNYIRDDRATVQHILLMTDSTLTDEAAIQADDAAVKATADTVYQAAISGSQSFEDLMAQYNEDTGEDETGYTFTAGQMVPEFEEAAFALGIGEISEPVKSDYGYHIIKRNAGLYELEGYWREQAKVKINESRLADISVKEIMDDIQAANEELAAEEEAAAEAEATEAPATEAPAATEVPADAAAVDATAATEVPAA